MKVRHILPLGLLGLAIGSAFWFVPKTVAPKVHRDISTTTSAVEAPHTISKSSADAVRSFAETKSPDLGERVATLLEELSPKIRRKGERLAFNDGRHTAAFENGAVRYQPNVALEHCARGERPKTPYLVLHFAWQGQSGGQAKAMTDAAIGFTKGSMIEKYELNPNGIEQSFVIDRASVDRDLVLRGELETNLEPRLESTDEIGFYYKDRKFMHYKDAVAVDTAGSRISIPMALQGRTITLTVPRSFLKNAAFPLTIDPVIGIPLTIEGVSNGANAFGMARQVDIARMTGNDYVVVYVSQFAGNDYDVKLSKFTTDYLTAPTFAPIYVVSTTAFEGNPSVAFNSGSGTCLVAYERQALDANGNWTGTPDVFGKIYYPTNNTFGSEIAISSTVDNEANPDVDSDGTQWLVAFEKSNGTTYGNIQVTRVNQNGAIDVSIIIDSSTSNQSIPSIAAIPGSTKHLVAWSRKNTTTDVYGRIYDSAANQFAGPTFVISASGVNAGPGQDIAGNSTNNEWLVPIVKVPNLLDQDVVARRVSVTGVVGNEIPVHATPTFEHWPSATWTSTNNQYLMVWTMLSNSGAVYGARIAGGTDTIVQNDIKIVDTSNSSEWPSVTINPSNNLAVIAYVKLTPNLFTEVVRYGLGTGTAPTGSVVINAGAVATNTTNVTLTLSATGNMPVTDMRFMNDTNNNGVADDTWSAWEPYATTKAWTLGPATPDGTKFVFAQFRDSTGNVSIVYLTTIILDTQAPTGTIAINSGAAATTNTVVTLTLTGTDPSPGTGVIEMRLMNDLNLNGLPDDTWGAWEPFAGTKAWTLAPATPNGLRRVFAQFRDAAQNQSPVVNATITLNAANVGPTGTIVINGNAATTANTAVTLTLSANGPQGVSDMRFMNDTNLNGQPDDTWSAWESYATTKAWTLAPATPDGTRIVFAQFRDTAGNMSPVVQGTITLQTSTGAISGTIIINANAAATNSTSAMLTLTATGPVTEMRLMNDANLNGVADDTWNAWETFAASKAWTLAPATPDGTRKVFAQFRDAAGNVSAIVNATILLDTLAPTGSLVINGNAASTSTTAVTLTLTATDATSGVADMSFSNDGTTWSAWEPFGTTKAWTLTAGNGTKTVFARFRDQAQNVSAPVSKTIVLSSGPTGTVVINGGAAGTNAVAVTLTLNATVSSGTVANMRFMNDTNLNGQPDDTWSAWEAYATTKAWTLAPATPDGTRRVFAQFRDSSGVVSAVVSSDIALDTVAPTGTVTINGGAAFTNSANVMLTNTFTDPSPSSGPGSMRFSNNGATFTAWEPYASTKSWTLSAGDGVKTVSAKFRDAAGNESAVVTGTITVDSVAPTGVTLIAPANGSFVTTPTVTFSWTTSTDNNSLAGYEIQVDDDPAFGSPDILASPSTNTFTSAVADGTWYWRVHAIDSAGNVSPWSMVWSFLKDTAAPTSSVIVAGFYGPSTWPGQVVGTANDFGSGVKQVQVRVRRSSDGLYWNGATWQANALWLVANGLTNWSLPLAVGQLANDVSYVVESLATDNIGNVQATPSSSVFTFDSVMPVTTIATTGQFNLANWTGVIQGTAADALSGVMGVQVRIMRGSNSNFWTGNGWSTTPVWLNVYYSGGVWNYSFDPTIGETYTVMSRAIDGAGNLQAPPTAATFNYVAPAPGQNLDSAVATTSFYGPTNWPGLIAGTASGTGLSQVRVRIRRINDGLYWTGSGWGAATWLNANGTTPWTVPFTAVEDGRSYFVESQAFAGATGEVAPLGQGTFMYDMTLPTTTLSTNGAYTPATWTGIQGTASDAAPTGASASGIDRVQLAIRRTIDGLYWNGQSWGIAQVWVDALGIGNWFYSFTPINGFGHTVQVRAVDRSGNVQSPVTNGAFVLDGTEPNSSIFTTGTIAPSAWTGAIEGAASDIGSMVSNVQIRIHRLSDNVYWNGSTWVSTPTWVPAVGTTSWKSAFAPAQGVTYRVESRATDIAGNVQTTPAVSEFVVQEGGNQGGIPGGAPVADGGSAHHSVCTVSVADGSKGGPGSGTGLALLILIVVALRKRRTQSSLN